MPESVFGLPLHPLIVHATVMVIPAAAALLVLSALLPRFRHWARFLTPLTAVTALVLVPITTSAGEALKEQVGDSPAIEKHAELASYLLPWVVGLTVVTMALYAVEWRNRRFGQEARASRPVAVILAVLALIVGGGATTQVVLTGHAGAEAAWSSVSSEDQGSHSGSGSSGSDDSSRSESGSSGSSGSGG